MTIELALLAASVVLGVVHVIIVAHLQSWQRGLFVDGRRAGTERRAAHRPCRKG